MSGALQAVFQNQRSFGRAIGSAYEGGFFAGQISTAGNGIADFNLVVGPVASAESGSLQWKTSSSGTDPSSVINGPANSSTMNSATYPAAQFCEGLTIGGFSDWYMPAKNELEVCYYNLKPNTSLNDAGYGINTNAVPSRGSGYTSGTPAQTSATVFKTGNAEAYSAVAYWSSTQASSANANGQSFDTGYQWNFYPKNTSSANVKVRAIRRVAV